MSLARLMAQAASGLKLYNEPEREQPKYPIWNIGGYPAELRYWTLEEWASEKNKPKDAQMIENLWVSLRFL